MGRRVERLHGTDAGSRAVNKGGSDRGLLAFRGEKRSGESLGGGLDDDEDGNRGENDEGERGGSGKREDEASDTGREVFDCSSGGQRGGRSNFVGFSKSKRQMYEQKRYRTTHLVN